MNVTEKSLAWKRWYAKASQDAGWLERRRAANRAEYRRARDKRLATAKKWAASNRETVREISRRFYSNHIEAERERSKQRDPVKRRASTQAHRRRNLLEYAAKQRGRQARKRAVTIGPVDYAEVIRAADGICGICGLAVSGEAIHIDHIVPLAVGGSHTQTNLQMAHARCNLVKGARVAKAG